MKKWTSGPVGQLALTNGRELLRDPATFFFVLVFPFLFLGLFAILPESKQNGQTINAIAFGLPAILVLAFGNLALLGTATTLVHMRTQGILRLFAVTPVTQRQFLAGAVPARLAIGLVQVVILLVLGVLVGGLGAGDLPRLIVTCMLGLFMFFSLGFLAGGYLRSEQATSSILTGLLPIAMIVSGVFVPFEALPEVFEKLAKYVPLTYLGDALRQDLSDAPSMYSIGTDWAVIGGTGVVLTVLAALTFRWDQGE